MSGAEGLVERLREMARRHEDAAHYEVPYAEEELTEAADALASLAAELVIAQKVARQWEQFGEQKEARIAELEKLVHTQAEEAAKAAREYADNMERLRGELAGARDHALEEAAKVAEERHEALGFDWTPYAIANAIRALKGTPPHE